MRKGEENTFAARRAWNQPVVRLNIVILSRGSKSQRKRGKEGRTKREKNVVECENAFAVATFPSRPANNLSRREIKYHPCAFTAGPLQPLTCRIKVNLLPVSTSVNVVLAIVLRSRNCGLQSRLHTHVHMYVSIPVPRSEKLVRTRDFFSLRRKFPVRGNIYDRIERV